jgi:aspartokinase/homoserine dehydrogenase 1
MSLENLQEESAAERNPAALHHQVHRAGGVSKQYRNVVAFKFGGSSLLGADRMLHAAGLVRAAARESSVTVVVSAMKGVTDHLLSIARALAAGKLAHARREAELVLDLHLDVLHDLHLSEDVDRSTVAPDVAPDPVGVTHDHDLRVRRELQLLARDLLHEVPVHGRVSAGADLFDRLASFGERFSARLFAAALEKSGVSAVPVTSSDFVLTCETFRDAQPHLAQTKHRGRDVLLPLLDAGIIPVVTGFIGATPDGRITTLGRNSSDFSGAIIAHVVDADELVIWTDVDGIYTANPNESAEARLLHELSYDEAHALAASGAKVLHAKVLPLAAQTEMVVWVRNTFNPQARGTRIGSPRSLRDSRTPSQDSVPIFSISSHEGGAA